MSGRQKTVLVTGAARGIGKAVGAHLAGQGYVVVGADLDTLESLIEGDDRRETGASDGSAIDLQSCDITDRSAVHALVEYCCEEYGSLDALVCNAGYLQYEPFLELTDDTWRRTIDVDLTGVFLTAQESARVMTRQGGGAIVVITSISAELPSRTQGHYAAAKAGSHMLAQAMAWELGDYGIRVNSVAPGWVETRITADYLSDTEQRAEVERTIPMRRVGQPDDVAKAVGYLLSDDAGYITGASLRVDGGLIVGKDKT